MEPHVETLRKHMNDERVVKMNKKNELEIKVALTRLRMMIEEGEITIKELNECLGEA